MSAEHTAARTALQSAGTMMIFALVFTAVMGMTYSATRPIIAASVEAEKMKLVSEVLPAERYDNALLDDVFVVGATPQLGLDEDGGRVYRARLGGRPAAMVIEAQAPDGYAGTIKLLVAIDTDNRITGVRVTNHRETPGLGDYIDPRKDRNKSNPWIDQFGSRPLSAAQLKVRKDGGEIDYRVGATISARAVTAAVAKVRQWAEANRDKVFASENGEGK